MSSSKGRLSLWKKKLFKHPPTANSQWPTEFICPFSMAPMADPVIVSSGQSYERRCIEYNNLIHIISEAIRYLMRPIQKYFSNIHFQFLTL